MKHSPLKRLGLVITTTVAISPLLIAPAYAMQGKPITSGQPEATVTTEATPPTSASHETTHTLAAGDTTKLNLIHQRGDNEVSRRLTSLSGLLAKINAATKLSASDKAALIAEVNAEIAGLTTLKTTVDNDGDVTSAKTDAQSIVTDYRVYALVVPKVQLVITADRQQVIEDKLTALAAKVQTSINTAKTAGKDTTNLQKQLDDLTAKTQAAQAISSDVETKVLALQPSDYNNDHKILSAYRDQLKTARGDIGAAFGDAKANAGALKNL